MPSIAAFNDARSYHIVTYGTLLGSTAFQTFLAGPIAFKALSRPAFSQLQQAIFPNFFALQTVLPLVLAFTWPGDRVAGAEDVVGSPVLLRRNAGWKGLLDSVNLWQASVPIGIMFATAFLNLMLLGPMTTKVLRERKHQETRDSKRYYDPGPHSDAMQGLNNSFMWMHGASSSANLIAFFAMIYYGASLAERL